LQLLSDAKHPQHPQNGFWLGVSWAKSVEFSKTKTFLFVFVPPLMAGAGLGERPAVFKIKSFLSQMDLQRLPALLQDRILLSRIADACDMHLFFFSRRENTVDSTARWNQVAVGAADRRSVQSR
jgi:hypothetical protein